MGSILAPQATAFPFFGGYLPLQKAALGSMFPQKKIADLSHPYAANLNAARLKISPENITLTGFDKDHKPWSIKKPIGIGGGSVWHTDLGGDAHQDLVIYLNTTACGIAPSAELVLIKFDGLKPSYSTIYGHFEESKYGVLDLRKLPGFNHAVLIQQALAHEASGKRSYWKTMMFSLSCTAGNEKSIKNYQNLRLPCYTPYTEQKNHRVVSIKKELSTESEQTILRWLSP